MSAMKNLSFSLLFSLLLFSQINKSFASNSEILTLNSSNMNLPCPKGFVLDRKHFKDIKKLVGQVSLSPGCIWDTIKKNAKNVDHQIHGFSFSTIIEASFGIGAMIGTELVLMPYDHETIIATMVRIESGSIGISLAGASFTQSVIFGDCPDNIDSYLGVFKSFGAIAMMNNFGHTKVLGSPTGCNSITSIRGMTSPIVGGGISFYNKIGKSILVKGKKVKPLLKFFKILN